MNHQYDNYIFDLYGTLIDVHTEEHEPKLWKQMSRYLKDNFNIRIKSDELYKLYTQTYAGYVEELKEITKSDYPEIRISWVWDDILRKLWNTATPESAGSNAKKARGRATASNSLSAEKTGSSVSKFTYPHRQHLFGINQPVDRAPEHIARLCTFFRRTSTYHMCNYPDTHRLLKTLKENGKKVYLLSNAQRAYTKREIGTCRLAHFFDDIFISSDKLIMKPEPRYLQMLLDKHGLDKTKCVMIGNEIKSDMEIARRCGVKGILVQNGDFTEVFESMNA
ncbi:HAD family hydrolase [Butyrivibrio sp. FCS014]|uniref:HAD family hydrolase n=1 Tax=Butyrivibrio sp. FCS014 TaxID=1408304 RepID=UPI000463C748|nr:HAD family hydrolase [Butyrivibrio sp. FCS014]